jgi:hypothetical protein
MARLPLGPSQHDTEGQESCDDPSEDEDGDKRHSSSPLLQAWPSPTV